MVVTLQGRTDEERPNMDGKLRAKSHIRGAILESYCRLLKIWLYTFLENSVEKVSVARGARKLREFFLVSATTGTLDF